MCTSHPVVWPSPQGPGCDSGGHTLSGQLPSVPGWLQESCSPGPHGSRGPLFPGQSACSAAAERDALSHLQSAKTALKATTSEDPLLFDKSQDAVYLVLKDYIFQAT